MLILASSSIYRKELLSRIIENYQIKIPDIDESKYDHEDAKTSAIRLALEKAEKIALTLPDNFIIGADQTAESNHIQINKPNNFEEAFDQLKQGHLKKLNQAETEANVRKRRLESLTLKIAEKQ